MAREFSRKFYHSKQWKSVRDAYARSAHGLCECCLAAGKYVPGEIVHHIIHLSPDNINDPNITLSYDNLELVCRDCHARLHPEIYGLQDFKPRVRFDANGNVIPLEGTDV